MKVINVTTRSLLREKIMVILYQIDIYNERKVPYEVDEVIKENIQSTSNYTVSLSYDATTGKVCEIGIVPASGTIGLTSDSDTNTVGTGTTNTVSTNTVGTRSIGY